MCHFISYFSSQKCGEVNKYIQSSGGTACTCVVTEFRHVDEDHTGPFTVEAQFMTSEEMKELLNELLTMFRQFHVNRFFRDLQSQEEQQKCRGEAVRAWETFESLFNNQPALTMGHLSKDYDGAHSAILAQLERWASAGLALRPGGLDALGYSAIAGDIEECRDILDGLTASNIGNGKPAIWPFIKLIRLVKLSLERTPFLIISQGISQITDSEERPGAR